MRCADVVVVGGGIAGLSAASECQRLGMKPLVFEASPRRLGGRIKTREGIEYGAEMLHTKRLLPLLRSLGLQCVKEDDQRGVYLFEAENPTLTRDCVGAGSVADAIRQLQEAVREKQKWTMSMQCFLDEHLRCDSPVAQILRSHPEIVRRALETEVGASLSEISPESLREASAFDDENYRILGGFSQFPERMARELSSISYHHLVRMMRWSDKGVEIVTSSNLTVHARKAIVTIPIGLLQRGAIQFDPQLPSNVQLAIGRIGNATICKIIIIFQREIWPDDLTLLRTDIPEAPLFWPNRNSSWPSLTCFVGGRSSEALRKMGQENATACVIGHLSDVFGYNIASLVKGVRLEAWNRKGNFMTGYSFLPVGAEDARQVLAQPICPSLILAGEACSARADPLASGTVAGAYFSGVQAAGDMFCHG